MKKTDDFNKKHVMELLESDDATPSMYINDISKAFNNTICHASDLKEVSHGSRRILFTLAHDDGLTQLQLVKLTHFSPPSVSVAVTKLENEGYVKRKADTKDLRQVRIYLTKKGRDHNENVIKKCSETESIMLNGISQKEQEQLCTLLKKMLGNLVERNM
ncbi:MAG: MarR family transcriptional regulator [Ruminococcus sp.]|nr:MarR family transcriptional regulator [Ruminococcus sp.]